MTRPSVEIKGVRELRRALKDVDGGLARLKSVHAAAASVVEKRATSIAPRRSGTLAGSIRSTGQASTGVVRAGRASVPYAGPIHFGWRRRNISPNPFLYDALDDRRDEVIETYRNGLNALFRKNGLDLSGSADALPSGVTDIGGGRVQYVTRAGVERTATLAQYKHWTRNL